MTKLGLFFILLILISLVAEPIGANEEHSRRIKSETDVAPAKGPEAEGKGEAHEEEENSAVGPEKGVTEFSEENGFMLSAEAFKNFGIATSPVSPRKKGYEIPRSSLMEAQGGKYVYTAKDGGFKRVPVEVSERTADTIVVVSEGISSESKVVSSGVPFLRGAELDVSSGGEGHGH